MHIVLDLQGAQGGSRFRGIGRYAICLARALLAAPDGHSFTLLLSGRMPEGEGALRAAFPDVPRARIRCMELPGPVQEKDPANAWRMQAAELVREHVLAELNPDRVLVFSPCEGLGTEVVTSAGRLHPGIATAAILYDLIPLQQPDTYLANPHVRRAYLRRVQALKQTDLLLAISESARREAVALLDVPEQRVATIGAGVDPFFRPAAGGEAALARHGLRRRAVLYAGAADPRKNLDGLLAAFALLPAGLRATHQLALVGRMDPAERQSVAAMARRHGVADDAVACLGYLPDADLRLLYSACAAFVFPSLHEGFGLPALEAMACGAPTIGSNTTSIPELIGRADAMFDPTRPEAIAARLRRVLEEPDFAASLRESGLRTARRFTWEATARRALAAIANMPGPTPAAHTGTMARPGGGTRPTLAFVAPLPPARCDVAAYCARLLPALARHYEITCIVDQAQIDAPDISANFPLRDTAWFAARHRGFDRVLYHFANAPPHQHIWPLLQACPGVVALHDFYLGGVAAWRARNAGAPHALTAALYDAHGYPALLRAEQEGAEAAVLAYPANAEVLRQAMRVLVHSRHCIALARGWYGAAGSAALLPIPFLPPAAPAPPTDRLAARARLGLAADDFLVCALGAPHPTDPDRRLLEAWRHSRLGADPACRLLPRGGGDCAVADRGQADALAAADAAVHLCADSRGETSGAIFACLERGVPLIVNAHGAAAELPDDAVLMLADGFTDAALVQALERLRDDPALRASLAERGRAHAAAAHRPEVVAQAYRDAIEDAYAHSPAAREQALVTAIGALTVPAAAPTAEDLAACAAAIVANRPAGGPPRILFDVTALSRAECIAGIERVALSILRELLRAPPPGWRVEPVRAEGAGYVHAIGYTRGLLGIAAAGLDDAPVEPAPGDVFLGLDRATEAVPSRIGWFRQQRRRDVRIVFKVYDILPIQHPEWFPPAIEPMTRQWLETLAEVADGLVCSSRAGMEELAAWLDTATVPRAEPPRLGWFHLGAELPAPDLSHQGGGESDPALAGAMAARPGFLMVGTLAPRKGHRQVLAAMEQFWAGGGDANLVIVGRAGWRMDDLARRLAAHPEASRRLFWLRQASDGVLQKCYAGATALIAASEGEGAGLPLIEAARHGLPVIARDLPVFRDVAGAHASYFHDDSPAALAALLSDWLARHQRGETPDILGLPWRSWRESTAALMRIVLEDGWPAAAGSAPARPMTSTASWHGHADKP